MRKLLALAALATSLYSAQVPRKAAEFVFQMPPDGHQQLLSAYKGKTIVLALMYTTCPHCQKTAGVLAQIQKEYAGRGVQILGAVFDPGAPRRVQEFHDKLGLNFPVGVSDTAPVLDFLQHPVNEPYFVPMLVFIDRHGMVRSQYLDDENFLARQEVNIRAEIDKLLRIK
jgi:peroxiredoxin